MLHIVLESKTENMLYHGGSKSKAVSEKARNFRKIHKLWPHYPENVDSTGLGRGFAACFLLNISQVMSEMPPRWETQKRH